MAARFLGPDEMRADEFAHNFAVWCCLEDSNLVAFADQGIGTGQPLRTTHMG